MKTKIFSIITFSLLFTSCNAQIMSLEQAAVYPEQPDGRKLPQGTTYIKDINNSLDKFIGIWKGSADGKIYEFRFEKKIAIGENIKRDKIIGRLLVKNSNGDVIYSSLDLPDDLTLMAGSGFQSDLKAYLMYFVHNSSCNDGGTLYLFPNSNNANQLSLTFWRMPDIINRNECPNIDTYKTLIPKDVVMTLIKQ